MLVEFGVLIVEKHVSNARELSMSSQRVTGGPFASRHPLATHLVDVAQSVAGLFVRKQDSVNDSSIVVKVREPYKKVNVLAAMQCANNVVMNRGRESPTRTAIEEVGISSDGHCSFV